MTSHADITAAPAERAAFGRRLLLAILLVLAVYVSGSPALNAPWIQGDEFIFIVNNPDVTGAGLPSGSPWRRIGRIFGKVHDDLYQPLPILTYALEWYLWGDQPECVRRDDLLLHALNGLLLWSVLATLLRDGRPRQHRPHLDYLAWALALLWVLHPVLVSTYASDMGRTHLLSATFALLALRFHLRALVSGSHAYFVAALAALVLAMLSKPIPGWVAVVAALECAHLGWRRCCRSPRVYLVAVICLFFAVLTYWTSRESGLIEDASKGLFGDPFSRSALAVSIYARNLVTPLWLAGWSWYLPDPETTWANPRVWLGLLLAAASLFAAWRAWRSPISRAATLGWVWCWALLLPVIGLVGAREAAAVDRYLYQPLMGLMLVIGVALARPLTTTEPLIAAQRTRAFMAAALALAFAMLLWDLPHCHAARSTLRRARRIVQLYPGDPRALEALAMAYDFARNHELPADDRPPPPADSQVDPRGHQFHYFNEKLEPTLLEAASAPNLTYYFPGPDDRAPFHRRLAFRLLTVGNPTQAFAQAELAYKLQPDSYWTWKQLALALWALERYDEALLAYAKVEQLLPDDAEEWAMRLTEFGELLLRHFDRPAEARPKYVAALQTGRAPIEASIGLALCEIRIGQGADGLRLIRQVLTADPTNLDALLVLGEYHLRSHHWPQAAALYGGILDQRPTFYEALRGFHEVSAQTNRWGSAAQRWREALAQAPGERILRSFTAWAEACAGEPTAPTRADALLADEPTNPLACYARMLIALRKSDIADALRWLNAAGAGEPVPEAQSHRRAAVTLQLLIEREQLPAEAVVVQAAAWRNAGATAHAKELLTGSLPNLGVGPARDIAQQLLAELSAAEDE
ncbi:MAG: hypothetical protein KKB50_04005 [Planctomycetes bacterium]|nr:hypothetical protein [Planctomycetota bacterium]